MKRKTSSILNMGLFPALLSLAVAVALSMRVFGFSTLPHYLLRVFVVGYLSLALGMAYFRFVRPALCWRWRPVRQILVAILVAGLVTIFLFVLVDYHIAPIRTLHTLSIQNTSETSEISVWEIVLPEGDSLELAETYAQYEYFDGRLLIPPGESITYSREMVGGVAIKVGAMSWPAQAAVTWDDSIYEIAWTEDGNAEALELPGWSWGTPSWLSRVSGILNIAVDIISVFGLTFITSLLLLPIPKKNEGNPEDGLGDELRPFSFSVLANLAILVISVLYAIFFNERLPYLMLFFASGLLLYLWDLAHKRPDWVFRLVIIVLAVGVVVNGLFWIMPPHEWHQVIKYQPDDRFILFAQSVGASNSKYLSVGFYKYLRDSSLTISTRLYNELGLDEGEFRDLNRIRNFIFQDYDDELSDSQRDLLLNLGEWSTWPTRIDDGMLLLLPEISAPGDTYYCFSHGQQYFLVPLDWIIETGAFDVPSVD